MKARSPRPVSCAAALTLLLCGAAGALAQSAGDTIDLKTTYVQRLDGARAGDDAGDRVANAGDVNRDGREDLIVGAYTADAGGRENAGAAYLVTSSAARRRTLGSGSRGIVEIRGGRKGDNLGVMVQGIGDVNGDGRPDQAVGSYGLTARGRTKAGSIWVILSTAGRRVINVRKPGRGVVRIDGSAEDAELDPAASAGDFNGDGVGDLVVGETDGAFVILGRRDFGAVDLGNPGDDVIPISPGDRDGFGFRVAGAGDVNADGLADVAVGYSGGAVVVFGRRDTSSGIDAGAAGFGGYDIGGASSAPDSLGDALAGIGDFNGDGRADLAVSASNAPARGKRRAGVVAIYFGKDGPEPQAYPPPAGEGLRILGAGNDDRAGYTVAGPGDLDGDGRPDVVVGSFLAGGLGRVDAGVTYRVSPVPGSGDVFLGNLGPRVRRWVGSRVQEQSGYAVDAADVDGDGRREIAVGAGFAAHRGRHSGSVYVVDAR